MKRKIIKGIFILAAVLLSGCGSGENKASEDGTTAQQQTAESVYKEENADSGILENVYKDGSESLNIPMGAVINDGDPFSCTVKMPANYNVYGSYETNDGYFMNLDKAYDVLLSDAFDEGAWDDETLMASCLLVSTAGDPVTKLQIDILNEAFDSVLPDGECREAANCAYRTLYCEPSSEYLENDETVYIIISEDILIMVRYSGPLSDSLGMEQLAQNIHNLFTVNP